MMKAGLAALLALAGTWGTAQAATVIATGSYGSTDNQIFSSYFENPPLSPATYQFFLKFTSPVTNVDGSILKDISLFERYNIYGPIETDLIEFTDSADFIRFGNEYRAIILARPDTFTRSDLSGGAFIEINEAQRCCTASFGFDALQSGTFELSYVAYAGVPEPASWSMLVIGCGLIGFAMRRSQMAPVGSLAT